MLKTVMTKGHFGKAVESVLSVQDLPKGRFSNMIWMAERNASHHAKSNEDGPAEVWETCSECGETVTLTVEGDALVAKSACVYAGGMPAYEVLLDVPSGTLVFANDLRDLTEVEDDADLNTAFGQKAFTEGHAADGLALVFVGNTCPSVFKKGAEILVGDGGRRKRTFGSICTDLWWYSAMDKDLFLARCEAAGLSPEAFDVFEVEVPAGVYAVTDEMVRDRHARGVVYSRIRKTDAARPRLRARSGSSDTLADSLFWAAVNKKSIGMSRDAMLCEILTVLGNGYGWHNGNLRSLSTRGGSKPHRVDFKKVDAPRDAGFVPELPNFSVGFSGTSSLYPMGWTYDKLGTAPTGIDLYWLAGGMMFAKSVLASDFDVIGPYRGEVKVRVLETVRQVLIAGLDVLCEIAEVRGVRKDGSLDSAFAEIRAAWA